MSKEQPQPTEPFSFTEEEKLWDRVSDQRFRQLLDNDQTTVHRAELSTNSYGEFLFVTVIRSNQEKPEVLTFYGMGYHEYRECWITNSWFWYQTNPFPAQMDHPMNRDEVQEMCQARQEEIAPYATEDTQTKRGRLFEMLADLTDDDGAIAEMEDLSDLWDDLTDNFE